MIRLYVESTPRTRSFKFVRIAGPRTLCPRLGGGHLGLAEIKRPGASATLRQTTRRSRHAIVGNPALPKARAQKASQKTRAQKRPPRLDESRRQTSMNIRNITSNAAPTAVARSQKPAKAASGSSRTSSRPAPKPPRTASIHTTARAAKNASSRKSPAPCPAPPSATGR